MDSSDQATTVCPPRRPPRRPTLPLLVLPKVPNVVSYLPPPVSGPSEILPGLFLGDRSDAANASHAFTCIVNCTADLPNSHEDKGTIYLRLPMNDHAGQDIEQYFDVAFDFIDKALARGEKVLVHCFAGISRSASIILYYTMKTKRMTLNDAFAFVKARRHIISPNFGFMGTLYHFERTMPNVVAFPAPAHSPVTSPRLAVM